MISGGKAKEEEEEEVEALVEQFELKDVKLGGSSVLKNSGVTTRNDRNKFVYTTHETREITHLY